AVAMRPRGVTARPDASSFAPRASSILPSTPVVDASPSSAPSPAPRSEAWGTSATSIRGSAPSASSFGPWRAPGAAAANPPYPSARRSSPTRDSGRLLLDGDRGEGGGIHVDRGHALDVRRRHLRDARLEAVGPVEAELVLLHHHQEGGHLARRVEAERITTDEVRLGEVELTRGDELARHPHHFRLRHAHRLVDAVEARLQTDEVARAVTTEGEGAVDGISKPPLLPYRHVEARCGAATQDVV